MRGDCDRNRTWAHSEIGELKLCTTLFRNGCGNSSLLMSTVISLPYEVSTEALIPDLELTRVSVNQFTAETANLAVGRSLICSVSQGYSNSPLNRPIQKRHPVLASESGISPILSRPVPRPRAHVRSSAGPPRAPSLVRARCAPSSTLMPERRLEARLPARTAPGSSESGSLHHNPRCSLPR